jgi:hypothetical protein
MIVHDASNRRTWVGKDAFVRRALAPGEQVITWLLETTG